MTSAKSTRGHERLSAEVGARPSDVAAGEWQGLFEFVVWKLALLVGGAHVLPFVRDLCHPSRFASLTIGGASPQADQSLRAR